MFQRRADHAHFDALGAGRLQLRLCLRHIGLRGETSLEPVLGELQRLLERRVDGRGRLPRQGRQGLILALAARQQIRQAALGQLVGVPELNVQTIALGRHHLAAVLAAVYALFVGLFIYRELSWRELPRIFKEAVNTSAVVGFIVAGASLFGWVLARERVPQAIAEAFLDFSTNPYVILLIINLVMLILGCFMEGIAIMILMVPVFMPVIQQLGIDVNHFGVIVVMNLMIGILTPPFGVLLFITMDIARVSFGAIVRAIIPFYIPLAFVLILVLSGRSGRRRRRRTLRQRRRSLRLDLRIQAVLRIVRVTDGLFVFRRLGILRHAAVVLLVHC